jgi:predicted Zn-dependent protease
MARKSKLSPLQVKVAAAVVIVFVSVAQYAPTILAATHFCDVRRRYLLSREYDEVTGEKHQFGYSIEQEIEIGSSAAPQFIRENGGEVSGRAAELVRRLGNLVVKSSIANKSAYRFEFHLLKDDETINAFVSCHQSAAFIARLDPYAPYL